MMRPLEQALLELAGRAEPIADEVLIARIETQLSASSAPPHLTTREEPAMTTDRQIHYETPQPQPPQRRWRGPVVALGTAALAIGVAVGIGVILGTSNDEPPSTAASPPSSVATTTPPQDTTTTVPSPRVEEAAIAPAELLTPDDLPARLDWTQPLPPGTGIQETITSLRDRDVFDGIILFRCPSPPGPEYFSIGTLGVFGESWVSGVRVTAVTSLRAVDVADGAGEGVGFGQVLYTGTSAEVTAAAAALRSELQQCLAVGRVGEFDGETVGLFEEIPIRHEGIAVRSTAIMGSRPFKDIFRMAIVPSGTRLLIIEEHEGIVRGAPVITDEEFATVVDTAIIRLTNQ